MAIISKPSQIILSDIFNVVEVWSWFAGVYRSTSVRLRTFGEKKLFCSWQKR